MNEIEYQKATSKKWNVYGGYEIACAARRVNLTIQSVLKQEDLILKQLESIEEEESLRQQVVVPIQYCCDCSTNRPYNSSVIYPCFPSCLEVKLLKEISHSSLRSLLLVLILVQVTTQ